MSDNERAALLAGWAQAVRAVKGLAEGGLRLYCPAPKCLGQS